MNDGESEDDESDNRSGYIDDNNDHDDNDLEIRDMDLENDMELEKP